MWLLLIVKLQIRAENANSQDQHHTVMCHLENHGNHENHGIREIQNPGFSLKTSSFLTVPFFLKVLGSAGTCRCQLLCLITRGQSSTVEYVDSQLPGLSTNENGRCFHPNSDEI